MKGKNLLDKTFARREASAWVSYPCLTSRKTSTRRSKSMASGASKSYSFLKALADCSGVNGL